LSRWYSIDQKIHWYRTHGSAPVLHNPTLGPIYNYDLHTSIQFYGWKDNRHNLVTVIHFRAYGEESIQRHLTWNAYKY